MEDIGSSGALMASGLPGPPSLTRQLSLGRSTSTAAADESKDDGGDASADAAPSSEGSRGGPDALLGSIAVRSGSPGTMVRPGMLVLYSGKTGLVETLWQAGPRGVVMPDSVSGTTIGLHLLSASTGLATVATQASVDNVRSVEALFGHPFTDVMVLWYVPATAAAAAVHDWIAVLHITFLAAVAQSCIVRVFVLWPCTGRCLPSRRRHWAPWLPVEPCCRLCCPGHRRCRARWRRWAAPATCCPSPK